MLIGDHTSLTGIIRITNLFYLFMDMNQLCYSPSVGEAWLESIKPFLDDIEHKHIRRILCLLASEGCGIAAEQVDLHKGILTILDSKGNKDRLVYMADDLAALCKEYFKYLCDTLSYRPTWFFPGRNPEKPLRNTSVDRVFNRFWSGTAFASSCNNKPTVHDLRFTFVTDRIDLWTMEGVDTNVMMPYLQRYLGHKNLQDSYYYYHNSKRLYEAVRIRDKTASQVIPEVPDYE